MAKRYFAEQKIEFREVDVMSSRRGLKEMVMMTGQYGVPVVLIGERAMVGWNEREFEALRAGKKRRR